MGKIVISEFMTLDGVVESPEKWQGAFGSEDMFASVREGILASDVALLGRQTYEDFLTFWPHQKHNEFGMADKINSQPKFIVSSTLKMADWIPAALIKGDAVSEIAKMKAETDWLIRIPGSITLVQALMQADLIDEYQLLIHPVVVGEGRRLFKDRVGLSGLKLIDSRSFSGGVVALTYAREWDKS